MPYLTEYQKELVNLHVPGVDTDKVYSISEVRSILRIARQRSSKAKDDAALARAKALGIEPGSKVIYLGRVLIVGAVDRRGRVHMVGNPGAYSIDSLKLAN